MSQSINQQGKYPRLHPGGFFLSPEQQREIAAAYLAGESCKKIAPRYGVDPQTIRKTVMREGVELRSLSVANRRYAFNEGVFDGPDLSEHAKYFIGLLMADGSISDTRHSVSLALAIEDIAIVEAFRTFLASEHPISIKHDKRHGHEFKNAQPSARLGIRSERLYEALVKYGVTPRKSATAEACPALAHDPHFWRGVIDGDGTIDFPMGTFPRVRLIGSKSICHQFSAFVHALCPVCRTTPRQDKARAITVWTIEFGGRYAVTAIKAMYDGCSVAIERKLARAKQAMAFKFKRVEVNILDPKELQDLRIRLGSWLTVAEYIEVTKGIKTSSTALRLHAERHGST